MNLQDYNRYCPMCDEELNEKNIARKHWTPSTKEGLKDEIRLDVLGRVWCQSCCNDFDDMEFTIHI